MRYFTDEFHKLVEAIIMRHICNAVSSVCKAQASHFATDVEPGFGI